MKKFTALFLLLLLSFVTSYTLSQRIKSMKKVGVDLVSLAMREKTF